MIKTVVTAPNQDIHFLRETNMLFFVMKPDICYKFSWIVTNTGNISCKTDTKWVRSGGPQAVLMEDGSHKVLTRSATKSGVAM